MKSIETLKCDFCGGSLTIDDSREFAKCEFCGTKYMASTLRAKIQEIRGTVNVDGAVETTKGEAEKERIAKNADRLFELHEYSEAYKLYKELSLQYPDDYRGWFGLYKDSMRSIIKQSKKSLLLASIPETSDKDLEHAYSQCTDKGKMNILDYFSKLIDSYGANLQTIRISNMDKPDKDCLQVVDSHNKKLDYGIINYFTRWILFFSKRTAEIIQYDKFDSFKKKLGLEYNEQVNNGLIIPFLIPKYENGRYKVSAINPLSGLEYKYSSLSFYYLYDYLITAGFDTSIHDGTPCIKIGYNHVFRNYQPYDLFKDENFFIFGKTIVLIQRQPQDIFVYRQAGFDVYRTLFHADYIILPSLISEQEIIKTSHRLNNLCQHCGGEFKGMFAKICSRCRRPKDY